MQRNKHSKQARRVLHARSKTCTGTHKNKINQGDSGPGPSDSSGLSFCRFNHAFILLSPYGVFGPNPHFAGQLKPPKSNCAVHGLGLNANLYTCITQYSLPHKLSMFLALFAQKQHLLAPLKTARPLTLNNGSVS